MEFSHKGTLSDIPAGYVAWFAVPGRKSADCTIVCGHWSTLGLLRRKDLLALDTGCVWGGTLTAVNLDDPEMPAVQEKCAACQQPGGD